jgi:hypothetical protein
MKEEEMESTDRFEALLADTLATRGCSVRTQVTCSARFPVRESRFAPD